MFDRDRHSEIAHLSIIGTEAFVPNLHEGETYQFRVRAVNAAGEGKPSKQTEPVTCRPYVSKCISSLHRVLKSSEQ